MSFLTGFLLGAGLSLCVTVVKIRNSPVPKALYPINGIVIGVAGGSVLGILMLTFYKFVIYFILGGFIALISHVMLWEFSGKNAQILQYPVGMVSLIFGTFLASLLSTFSTIVVTSGLGSFLLTMGIDCIIKSGFNHIFAFGFGYKWSEVGTNTSDEIFGLFAFWIIMFLWMGIRQLFTKESISKIKLRTDSVGLNENLEV